MKGILSFVSGLNMEDLSDININKFKRPWQIMPIQGYRNWGYSLLSSRWDQ